jgi:iron complex outermembrane receptor protein
MSGLVSGNEIVSINVVWGCLMAVLIAGVTPLTVHADSVLEAAVPFPHYRLLIHRASLTDAMKEFGLQTHLQVAHFSDVGATNLEVGPISGSYTPEEALRLLLSATGLTYRFVNPRTVAIVREAPSSNEGAPPNSATEEDQVAENTHKPEEQEEQEEKGQGNTRMNDNVETSHPHRGIIARLLGIFAACSTAALTANPACAQNTSPVAIDPAGAGSSELVEIIVTAQRRNENLQNVPIAVSVVQGAEIAQTNFREITDLQYMVPSLAFDPSNGGGFQIRGVGTQSFDFSNEQGVSIVLDDVVMDSQRSTGLIGLNDIDQVEVLRGPQGTLFGKNATAGVIGITTKKPVLNEFSANGSVSYGERNDHNVYGTINIPLGDTAALRISAFQEGQDGYGHFTVANTKLGTYREEGVRAKLLFEPSNDLEIMLLADYSHHWDDEWDMLIDSPPGITATSAANGAAIGVRNVNNADIFTDYTAIDDAGTSLHVNYTIGNQTFTSVTAYRYNGNRGNAPLDFVPTPLFVPYNVLDLQTHKFSQELRLASPTGQFFEYVAGLFYNDLKLYSTQLQLGEFGAPLPPNVYLAASGATNGPIGNNLAVYDTDNRGEAAFGQVKFTFNEKFDLAAGGRLTHDNNSASTANVISNLGPAGYAFIPISNTPVPPFGTATNTNLSYRVSPQYHFNPQVMAYAAYSTGYKGPGVAFISGINDPYREETVKSYEVGVKSELFDRRLRLNADIFDEKYTDFQAQILTLVNNLPIYLIGNAGGLTSKGVEGDLTFKPIQSLSLNGSVTYDEAYFTNYVDGPNIYTGNNLTNAPRWASSTAAEYTHPVGSGYQATVNANFYWRGETYTTIGDQAGSHVGGYGVLGSRLGFGPQQGSWHVGLYGRNLLDRYFPTGFFSNAPLGTGTLYNANARRTVGVYLDGSF